MSELTIGLAGDVMLGRLVNEQISIANNYKYPWGSMLPLLKSTDINIINLETTLTKSEKAVPKAFNFKADPDKVECLTEAKIDTVNLANNHILDFSEEGLIETIRALDKSGILHTGAGKGIKDSLKPAVIKRKDIATGVLGFTDNEPGWEAQEKKAGTNFVEINDEGIEKVEKEIKKIRSKVDILVLSMHWGPNMRQRPSRQFQDFARKAIDNGVDIFHGHSAHIFQGIEIYNGKAIFYDTGDFVDDYAVDSLLRNDRSFFYLVKIGKEGIKKIELIPAIIHCMQVNKATGNEYEEIINKIKKLSLEFGTKIVDGGIVELG